MRCPGLVALAVLALAAPRAHAQGPTPPPLPPAGHGAPTPPPLPPAGDGALTPPPPPPDVTPLPAGPGTGTDRSAGDFSRPAPKAPAAPSWTKVAGHVAGALLATDRFQQLALELFLGMPLGPPAPTGEGQRVAAWVLVPGLVATYGRLGTRGCAPPRADITAQLCVLRVQGGAGLKAGWALGVPDPQGVARLQRFYYAELDVLGGWVDLPSAPLAPGARGLELVLRLRGGLNWSMLSASDMLPTRSMLNVSVGVDWTAASPFIRGLAPGISVGVGF